MHNFKYGYFMQFFYVKEVVVWRIGFMASLYFAALTVLINFLCNTFSVFRLLLFALPHNSMP